MHKDEKEPKETLGEKVKDKAHEIKEDLKEDAEKMKEGVKKGAHDVKEKAHELKEKAAEKMDEMKEKTQKGINTKKETPAGVSFLVIHLLNLNYHFLLQFLTDDMKGKHREQLLSNQCFHHVLLLRE